jgi:peptide chain release factor
MKNKKYILQITSGRGPQECEWVVTNVLNKIELDAKSKGLSIEKLSQTLGQDSKTLSSVFIKVTGNVAQSFIDSWVGTIQWVGQSSYRKFHKRKNWFIGVFLVEDLPPPSLDENKILFQAVRSSGAGGQNVNKVSTAVRAIYQPNGMQVMVMDTRSQLQNKKLATDRLKEKILETHYERIEAKQQRDWANQTSIERGNAIRTYHGNEFKLLIT